MPKKVYEELQAFGVIAPQRFDQASIRILDFVDFTEATANLYPATLIAKLSDTFSAFERIVRLRHLWTDREPCLAPRAHLRPDGSHVL